MKRALVLASASPSRAAMLANAGITAEIIPSDVDESIIKQDMIGQETGAIAMALAKAKAEKVSKDYPDRYVIGADQILVCNGSLYDKPCDLAEAKTHLQSLSGQTHQLMTAAIILLDGRVVWQHLSTPALTMRVLEDAFIDAYLADVGDLALTSVGAYQLEGLGAQLFDRVEGDFFSILGLPLLPLLAFLRQQDVREE